MTNENSEKTVRAPWHLWVVGIVGLLWSAMGAFDYVMTEMQHEAYMGHFTAEQLEFFYGLPSWVIACWAIAVWGGVLGCILLLLRRGLAVIFFIASLVGFVLTALHNYGFANGYEIMGGVGAAIFSVIIFAVSVFLLLYARAMRQRGLLR